MFPRVAILLNPGEGRLCAVKRVRKPNVQAGRDVEGADSEEALEEFRVEVQLMKSLDHPSICRLLQVYEDPKNLRLGKERWMNDAIQGHRFNIVYILLYYNVHFFYVAYNILI